MAFTPRGICFIICLIWCCTASPSGGSSQELSSCSDPANSVPCFEASVPYKVVVPEAEAAVLRCVIRNLDKQVVTWMKNDGRDIPMTVGSSVFTLDRRVTLDHSLADEWNLVIQRVEPRDSGEYLCQVNGRRRLMARAYMLIVKESDRPILPTVPTRGRAGDKAGKTLLSDDQGRKMSGSLTKPVHIIGDTTAFEGTRHFPLTCEAKFSSRDAKANPLAAIQWYHQGVRQDTRVNSIDISMSWTDGDKAVSVLTINQVGMQHSGEWVCLKQPSESVDMETATHSLTVLAKKSLMVRSRSRPDESVASASFGIPMDARLSSSGGDLVTSPMTSLLWTVALLVQVLYNLDC